MARAEWQRREEREGEEKPTHDSSYGPSRTRNDDRLAGLDVGDVEDSPVRRLGGHSESSQVPRRLDIARDAGVVVSLQLLSLRAREDALDLVDVLGPDPGVLLPSCTGTA